MQYVFFRSWGISQNFCVKSNLTALQITLRTAVRLLLTVSYTKNWGARTQDVGLLVAPTIILLGEQLLPLLSRGSRPYDEISS